MKTRTYTITGGVGFPEIAAVLDGPSTARLALAREEFRAAYGFPDFPASATDVSADALTRINAEDDLAHEKAAADLHEPFDVRRLSEAELFVRWLKRERGFTDHPTSTFHYDHEE